MVHRGIDLCSKRKSIQIYRRRAYKYITQIKGTASPLSINASGLSNRNTKHRGMHGIHRIPKRQGIRNSSRRAFPEQRRGITAKTGRSISLRTQKSITTNHAKVHPLGNKGNGYSVNAEKGLLSLSYQCTWRLSS